LKNRAQGSEGYINRYPGGTPSVSELGVPSPSSGGVGQGPGLGGACRGGGTPVPLRPERVSGLFAVRCWEGRQPSV